MRETFATRVGRWTGNLIVAIIFIVLLLTGFFVGIVLTHSLMLLLDALGSMINN